MKIIFCTLSVLIALLTTTQLAAIVSCRLFQAPNGKLMIILGEVHQENSTITVVIEELKKARLKKPLPIVVELSEEPKEQIGIASDSLKALFALEKSFNKDAPFTISCCEPRGDMSTVIELFRKEILAFCRELATQEEFIEHTNNLYREQKTVASAQTESNKHMWTRKKVELLKSMQLFTGWSVSGFTVRFYREYLDKNLAFIKQCRDKQKVQNWYLLFNALIKVYSETIQEITQNLAHGNDKEPLGNRFVAGVMACETPEDLLAWTENWYQLYLKRADYFVLDVAMYARIADSLVDDRPLCLIMGEGHASAIAKVLPMEPLGWKLLEEATCWHEFSFFAKSDYKLGSEPMNEFEGKLQRMMSKVLEPLLVCCAVCQKTEDVKSCSVCKHVYYCGVECQKSAWKEHKPVCKSVKVKI